MSSFFMERGSEPSARDVKKALGDTSVFWQSLVDFTKSADPRAFGEWKYWGPKNGWGFRVKDKKRALIYMGPRNRYFVVSMIFGQKAFDKVMQSDVDELIKAELRHAKSYVEGRGIRLEIRDGSLIPDIKKLVEIKVAG